MENIFIGGAVYMNSEEQGIKYKAYYIDTMQIKLEVESESKKISEVYNCESTLIFGLFGVDKDNVNALIQCMLEKLGWEHDRKI